MSVKLADNLKAEMRGEKLVLTINLSKKGKESGSGKSRVLATTGRGKYLGDLDEDLSKVGITMSVYRIKGKGEKSE